MSFDHQNKSTFLNGRLLNRERGAAPPLRPIISPSLMVADATQLLLDSLHVLSPEGGQVEWLHVDVIDGHFAPNMSFCPDTVRALRRRMPHAFLDCHLMVTDPASWIEPFAAAGASGFTFHVETVRDAREVCRRIRQRGMQAGIALKPATPISAVEGLVAAGEVDMVLVMTVEPGFAGQAFLPGPLAKVAALRTAFPGLNIQVDGSINLQTVEAVAAAGANVLVPGQAVFKAGNRAAAVGKLRGTVEQFLGRPPAVAAPPAGAPQGKAVPSKSSHL